ncbi:TonB-dependent receptor domain-containing protein [Caulobacter endophyticus]|uniref:TonB-dependent receptor domain-containing protein n=1 Tax=Caulobacter endophyticus TaxID=2172652 RepID=UPI00240EEFF5|nr:TonB-dependent receptor [Caulobacter endophyticus]MDG2531777.1 TonB-dependent receptor [Caulobacter endophyticus]
MHTRHRRCALAGWLALAAFATPVVAAAAPRRVDIAAGTPMARALTAFSAQTDTEILFNPALVVGLRAPRVRGRMEADEALDRLLVGSGLVARRHGGRLLIERGLAGRAAPAPSPAPMASAEIDAVMVTALRRTTAEQNTPLSIRVVGGEALKAAGAVTFERAAQRLPGLTLTSTGVGRMRMTLRGVYGSGEATTALYYNDIPVSGPSGTTADPGGSFPDLLLVDIDRLEVLRGPQGTLYGSSAMGGAVKVGFNRADPSRDQLGLEIEGGVVGGEAGGAVTAVANKAFADDRAALRLTAYRRDEAAFSDNARLGLKGVNAGRTTGGRLAGVWRPSEALRFDLLLAGQDSRLNDTGAGAPGEPSHVSRNFVRTPFDSHVWLGALSMEARLPGTRFSASLARYEWDNTRQIDYTGTLQAERGSAAGCARWLALGAGLACDTGQMAGYASYVDSRTPGLLYQPIDLTADVREARLSSDRDGPLQWTVGVFSETRRDTIDSQVRVADPRTGLPVDAAGFTGRRIVDTRLDQVAVYGEATLAVDDRSDVTIGARRFSYDKRTIGEVLVVNVISDTSGGNFRNRVEEDGWSVKGLASRRFAPGVMGYIQVSQGFRPGGINTAPGLPAELQAYGSDTLWNRELGLKSRWLSGRLSANLALYSIDWRDMQYSATSDNGAFAFVTNLGRARIDGVEFDATWSRAGSKLGFNFAATEAVLTKDQTSGALAGLGREGDHLPAVPRTAFTLWGETRRELAGGATLILGGSAAYVGESRSTFESVNPGAGRDLGGVTLIDGRAAIEIGRRSVGLFVENLLDSDAPLFITAGRLPQSFSPQPRRIGMNIRFAY